MRLSNIITVASACAGTALARDARHVKRDWDPRFEPQVAKRVAAAQASQNPAKSTAKPIIPQTNKTAPFKVDGSKIPNVTFDIGESYAGLLPISEGENVSELYFWFFPSENAQADDEILIW